MIQPSHSLVRYDNPVLVSRTDAKGKPALAPAADKTKALLPPSGSLNQNKKLPPVEEKGRVKTPTQTEDILNSILPPR